VDAFWIALGLKAIATALVVVTASVVAERVGPKWGGLVASIPVSAGPAYVLLALQHDAAFIAHSALLSFASGAATWIFLLAFVRISKRFNLAVSLPSALLIWLGTAIIIRAVPWTWPLAVIANVIAFVLATILGRPASTQLQSPSKAANTWYELPLRAAMVGVLVATVVTLSDAIGPSATGIAAVFPIALTSLAVMVNRRFGIMGATAALAGAITPMIGIASGFAVLSLTPEILGTWPALTLALCTALVWTMSIVMRHRA
jgi:uncharacterized membrane protein (DUF485 family)